MTSKEFRNVDEMQSWLDRQRETKSLRKETTPYDGLIEKLASIDLTLKEICQNLRKQKA